MSNEATVLALSGVIRRGQIQAANLSATQQPSIWELRRSKTARHSALIGRACAPRRVWAAPGGHILKKKSATRKAIGMSCDRTTPNEDSFSTTTSRIRPLGTDGHVSLPSLTLTSARCLLQCCGAISV